MLQAGIFKNYEKNLEFSEIGSTGKMRQRFIKNVEKIKELEVHFDSSPPMEKSNFLYGIRLWWKFFRLYSIRKKVIQKTNFQGQWAAGEMKIQNEPIKPKIVSIICASFVLQFLTWIPF